MSQRVERNFHRGEFACEDECGFDCVDHLLVMALQRIRDHFGAKVIITSGCRCLLQNKLVGGAESSFHLKGRAADFHVVSVHNESVYALLCHFNKGKYGIKLYPTHIHLDTREHEWREDYRERDST